MESLTAAWRVGHRASLVAAPLLLELTSTERANRRAATQILIEMPALPDAVTLKLEEMKQNGSVASRPAAEILRQRTWREQ